VLIGDKTDLIASTQTKDFGLIAVQIDMRAIHNIHVKPACLIPGKFQCAGKVAFHGGASINDFADGGDFGMADGADVIKPNINAWSAIKNIDRI
jgi:hypothetical protein